MNNSCFNDINEKSKKYNIDIEINKLDEKIFYKLIPAKDVLKFIDKNKSIKRKIKTIITYFKKEKFHSKLKPNLSHNKYIFMILSFIISTASKTQSNIFEKNAPNYNKIIDYMFLFVIKMYRSELVPFNYVIYFFYLYYSIIETKNINMQIYIEKIMYIFPFFIKFLKIAGINNINNNDEKNKKIINDDIKNILRKLFTLNDGISPLIYNINFSLNIIKQIQLFELLKLVYDYYDNIISEENKNYIKTNLINFYSNHFDDECYNYLYNNILKKLLRSFNTKNKKPFINRISLMGGISDFLLKIYQNEIFKLKKNEFYFNKYFIFDSNDKNCGIATSSILFNSNNTDITIIFSFYANNNNNKSQILFTLRKENEEYLFKLVLIGNKLYLITYGKNENKLLLLENIPYCSYNLCILHYVQSRKFIYFFLNKITKAERFTMNIAKNTKIYIEIGHTKDIDENKEIFNGMIGPILIFNSNIDYNRHHEIFQHILVNLKGQYYLIGEIYDKQNNNSENENNDNNYIFFDQIYYYEIDNNTKSLISKIRNELGILLLYFNPDVVLNTVGYSKKKIFRDYQNYELSNDKNSEKKYIYYNFSEKLIVNDYPRKENKFFYFFMYNHGYDLLLFNIEYIYNYLLISNNNYNAINFPVM